MKGNAPLVCWFQECRKEDVPLVGGKNSSLGELINAGIRVPPGFALTTHAYRQFIEQGKLSEKLMGLCDGIDDTDMQALEAASVEARRLIEETDLTYELEDSVAEYYRKLSNYCCMPATPVAVRSSATAEDLPDASFAGQQDTYLWIRGVDDVLNRVKTCISSLYTARAIAYRNKNKFKHHEVAISVGIQKMANSWTAGVMFTLNPSNGDRSSIVIDSNFGFGESVVSGEVTPDQFLVNKVSEEIMARTISCKEVCYTVDPITQTSIRSEVPAERQEVQSLLDHEIEELARMGKLIEKHYGRPMDVEWAVDKTVPSGGNIFILQARPETVWSARKTDPVSGGRKSALEHIVNSVMTGKRLQ
ncbi:MAG: phenylphosphate synthase subunit beta [Proteobacteria bacterium]|nr:MAG: phenylphosphate synthase subunit beta [Pseudomonadota bacterium]QKK12117.1 MAG: phenylphosphate synthase subunit beta [Pseudomonadota bacterium]